MNAYRNTLVMFALSYIVIAFNVLISAFLINKKLIRFFVMILIALVVQVPLIMFDVISWEGRIEPFAFPIVLSIIAIIP